MVTPVKRVPIHLQSAQNRLIIKNGTVVNDDGEQQVDIYIEDQTIRMMGNHLIIPGGTRTLDATGKYVMPGGIDMNVHLQRPGYGTQTIDDFYQGTKAALAGGTTMVVDMVVPAPGETAKEAFIKWRKWADDKVCCDYALKMCVREASDSTLAEMEQLSGPDYGVNLFTLNMAGEYRLKDNNLLTIMEKIGRLGGLAVLEAENGSIIKENESKVLGAGVKGPEGHSMAHPEEAQTEAVMRGCVLANASECPLYVNSMMSAAAADILRRRKEKGYVVVGEVTPAALSCDGAEYWNKSWVHSAAYVCTPPLMEGEMDKLMDSIADGATEVVSSQHTAYNSKQKALGAGSFVDIPKGVTGVEERLMVLWNKGVVSGKINRQQFVSVVSSTPAKLLNLYPQKGRIEVGSDADIVIWDPAQTRTLGKDGQASKCDFSIFEGQELVGVPDFVLCRGRLVKDQEIFRPAHGFGLYRELEPFSPLLYDKLREKAENQQVRAVLRTEADMPHVNGATPEEIPPPTPEEAEEPPINQQKSNFDLNSYPQTPDFDSARSSPSRSSVRVRAPPGGISVGFW